MKAIFKSGVKRFICPNKGGPNLFSPGAAADGHYFTLFHSFFHWRTFFFLLTCCAAAFKIPHLENKRRCSDSTRFSLTWLLLNLSRARGSGSLIMTSAHIFSPSSVLFLSVRRAGCVRVKWKGALLRDRRLTIKIKRQKKVVKWKEERCNEEQRAVSPESISIGWLIKYLHVYIWTFTNILASVPLKIFLLFFVHSKENTENTLREKKLP